MINARAETIAEKASFKRSFKHKRCLVPSDGFYEWKKGKPGATKQPLRITLKTVEPFAFAGLWETWTRPGDGEMIYSFTIITTTANELLATLHDRMPVILNKKDEDAWLDPDNTDIESLKSLLVPYPAKLIKAYEVSDAVNSSKSDKKEYILPLA